MINKPDSIYQARALGEVPPFRRYITWVPIPLDSQRFIKVLGKCNPGLDVSKIHVKARQPGARGMTMILGIEQEMETLIQATNGKLRFATDPIQLRLAKQHQRGKGSGSGASVAVAGAWATGVPLCSTSTSGAGGSLPAGSSSHNMDRPRTVGAGVKPGPPAPSGEGKSRSKYSASASGARTDGPRVQSTALGPYGEGNGGGGRPTLSSSVVRAGGGRTHLSALKAPSTDNGSVCPPVPPTSGAGTVDVGIHSGVPGLSSEGNGGGARHRAFSSPQPGTTAVVAGVPSVLADSIGTSATARPSASERISAPPSNKKKKKKGKKGKKNFFSSKLLVKAFADTRAYLLKSPGIVPIFRYCPQINLSSYLVNPYGLYQSMADKSPSLQSLLFQFREGSSGGEQISLPSSGTLGL